ncbi:hypothetical protein MUP01_08285 [Candidatus Bathyarchaeota archaeon]|nr:hypothetical protein [Candidatus Bathyarchaeota archaeon]
MSNTASSVAGALYHSGCLKFGSFKIKSGISSPYYVDLSCLLSSPRELCNIAKIAADEIRKIIDFDRVDKLASIELKGALILPSIACELKLPCTVIRKEEKGYGVTGRMAGAGINNGDHILFFDDVLSEDLSKPEGIRPLESLGALVKHLLVVVDRQQGGRESLEKLGYSVHALAKINEFVKHLLESKQITVEQTNAVLRYVKQE